MRGHTPAPWTTRPIGDGRVAIDGQHWVEFATVVVEVEEMAYREGEANARLIAAAPDLLASCKALLEAAPSRDIIGADVFDNARSAIIKATGEPIQ